MTDFLASGSSVPGGVSPETSTQAGDVTGSLADLERKLRELEQELTSIGRRRAATDAEPTPDTAPVEPVPSRPSGRLIDEAVEPPPPAPPPTPAPAPAHTPERVRPSEAQLASLAELRRFRDRLERFAKELSTEYDALLGRVMTSLSSAPAQTAPAPAQTASASAQTASAPVTPSPVAPSPAVAAAESRENALFEGRVELGVGPFYDIASLGAFEQCLASVAGVSEATVRRFEASHAVVDVRLSAPVALVRELRRAVDSGFSVREIASGRILLTFDEA